MEATQFQFIQPQTRNQTGLNLVLYPHWLCRGLVSCGDILCQGLVWLWGIIFHLHLVFHRSLARMGDPLVGLLLDLCVWVLLHTLYCKSHKFVSEIIWCVFWCLWLRRFQTPFVNCIECKAAYKYYKLLLFTEFTGGAPKYARRYRDPAVQQGKPLPDKGVCRHFRQSHRWLR